MMDKINFFKIIQDHIHTLKDFDTKKYKLGDLILFFISPLVVGFLFIKFNFRLDDDIANVLVTSLSIFAALLFNLLLLIYNIILKPDNSESGANFKNKFLKEIFSNISFCILISIFTIMLLIISFLDIQKLETILTFLVYYFISLFILTLFMVLKRVHILLTKEFEKK